MPENEEIVIAERAWTYHASPTEEIPVPVRFTLPRVCKGPGVWECRFSIFWPDGNVIQRRGVGLDSLEALINALEIFKVECSKLKASIGDKISFDSSDLLS